MPVARLVQSLLDEILKEVHSAGATNMTKHMERHHHAVFLELRLKIQQHRWLKAVISCPSPTPEPTSLEVPSSPVDSPNSNATEQPSVQCDFSKYSLQAELFQWLPSPDVQSATESLDGPTGSHESRPVVRRLRKTEHPVVPVSQFSFPRCGLTSRRSTPKKRAAVCVQQLSAGRAPPTSCVT